MERLRCWLAHPRLPVLAALLAVTLTLPALGVGWQLDDLFHRAQYLELQYLELAGTPGGPTEVFSIITFYS